MCGISGILDFKNHFTPHARVSIVNKFCEMQHHRGPDAVGIWKSSFSYCVLGHTRLAIIDLDERSNQPMRSANGRFAMTFNGEIYNYKSLKLQLEEQGVEFRTQSDTEVILEGYTVWGDDLFEKLDGMYALAIYDEQKKTLLLSRDRVGEKPLYYAKLKNTITFCSELKPLLTIPGISKEISESSLFEYLSLRYVAEPNTIFSSIKSIKSGTYVYIDMLGNIKENSYYAFDVPNIDARYSGSLEEYVDELETAMIEAVTTRLNADVPVGAFLSSGVDSSLVCSIASLKLNRKILCFSAGFQGSKESETDSAKKIAEHLGLPFEAQTITSDDLLNVTMDFGNKVDELNGDRSCVPTYVLSGLIRRRVTVAVSGDGGDELFGGYGRYLGPERVGYEDGTETDAVCEYLISRLPVFNLTALTDAMPSEYIVFRRRFASRFSSAYARPELAEIERQRIIDFHSYLPGAVLAKVDRMSMQHSLEVRTPFFSPNILELSAVLPLKMSTDGKQLKIALRKLLNRYLPNELITSNKMGFGMPPSFFTTHENIFAKMAQSSDEILVNFEYFHHRKELFNKLLRASRANINSYWAWIVLGQWVGSLPTEKHAA